MGSNNCFQDILRKIFWYIVKIADDTLGDVVCKWVSGPSSISSHFSHFLSFFIHFCSVNPEPCCLASALQFPFRFLFSSLTISFVVVRSVVISCWSQCETLWLSTVAATAQWEQFEATASWGALLGLLHELIHLLLDFVISANSTMSTDRCLMFAGCRKWKTPFIRNLGRNVTKESSKIMRIKRATTAQKPSSKIWETLPTMSYLHRPQESQSAKISIRIKTSL